MVLKIDFIDLPTTLFQEHIIGYLYCVGTFTYMYQWSPGRAAWIFPMSQLTTIEDILKLLHYCDIYMKENIHSYIAHHAYVPHALVCSQRWILSLLIVRCAVRRWIFFLYSLVFHG